MFDKSMTLLPSLHMGLIPVGPDSPPIMIAEEGQANQGDLSLALKMCEKASEADADGIEFQFFLADDMYTRDDPGYSIYKQRELSYDEIRIIIEFAKDLNLLVQVAGFSPKLIEFCSKVGVDSFCVNATDLNNPYILDAVAGTGVTFWLATLMASLNEIDSSVDYLIQRGAANFGLLHGQHVMSTGDLKGVPPNLLQLDCITLLQQRYDKVVGFVDHSVSTLTPALAVSKGALLVTKHLSPYEGWIGPDSDICLSPDSWRISKELFDYSFKSTGNSKDLSLAELSDRNAHRRSLYTSRDIPSGHILTREDISALRPYNSESPATNLRDFIGSTISRDLPAHTLLTLSLLSSLTGLS